MESVCVRERSERPVLCRSPLQAKSKLHPACLARAWSMWSRKPMPVFTLMVCDLLSCFAWSEPLLDSSFGSVSGGKSPPSRFRASWILVSLVSRVMAAQRGVEEEPISFQWEASGVTED